MPGEENIVEQNQSNSFDKEHSPFVLVILDGWGLGPAWGGNAITHADTHNFNKLWQECPSSSLQASGRAVGLPEGAGGNSEAGHLNIGAGRLVMQDETIIDQQIENGEFFHKTDLIAALDYAKAQNSTVHMMGLLSEAGVHSHIRHLYALLKCAKNNQNSKVKIHLFSDGRDSSPMSGIEMIEKVEKFVAEIGVGQIASITGRFYAMDRDNRWGRTSRAYNAWVRGEAERSAGAMQVFSNAYARGITDEFIEPRIIANDQMESSTIKDKDVIINFNFRPDRVRQMTMSFLAERLEEFPDRQKLNDIKFVTFTMYEQHYGDWPIIHIFSPDKVQTPMARVISEAKLSQLHLAETEKYAHVTYFFDGGVDNPFPGEDWKLVPSPKVKTYDLSPKMSAQQITTEAVGAINSGKYEFIIINFANPDMVGHSGNLSATTQAVSFTDQCLGSIQNLVAEKNGTLFICADHGNAEQEVNPATGQADTEHTTNPVPFIIMRAGLDKSNCNLSDGALCDIAPTMLHLANLPIPKEMTGKVLIYKS